jgi:hypothetical protein
MVMTKEQWENAVERRANQRAEKRTKKEQENRKTSIIVALISIALMVTGICIRFL